MADIFISYSHEDKETAREYAASFHAIGWSVWWDPKIRTGKIWDATIEAELNAAKAVIVLWSTHSRESIWVRSEAQIAKGNGTLMPVLVEECILPPEFRLVQTCDLRHWNGALDDPTWVVLVEDIRAKFEHGRTGASPTAKLDATSAVGRAGRDGVPTLAIMPFASPSRRDHALRDGMVDDLISALSLSPELRVLDSSSTREFSEKSMDARAIGREFGVRYVLEGKLKRSKTNLHVTVRLVDTETSTVQWVFQKPPAELAALQGELVGQIVAQLGVKLQFLEFDRALRKPNDLDAYCALQRAILTYAALSRPSLEKAITEARKAIEIEPDYALAHSFLAFSLAIQFTWTPQDESKRQNALKHVDTALSLAPLDPVVLARSARALTYLDQADEALEHAERAYDLNPNLAQVLQALGAAYLRLGRNDKAIECFDKELTIAPGNYALYVSYGRRAQAHLQAGQLQQALDAMERAFRINGRYVQTLVLRAGLCVLLGQKEEAKRAVRQLRRLEPDTTPELHRDRYLARVHAPSSRDLMDAFFRAWEETPLEISAQ